ncbi:unnamed protein product [Peronospora belbahrii]|uniref:Uncharacterized protein n=1 Tax=Peronospora belbahrii TaxID=622444 RepID=A0AAU9LAC2_9STRA|nr:unnamed protein product [Peronospora belbahrii]
MSAVGLSQAQQEGLQKLLPILGPKGVDIAQGEDEGNKRIHMLDEYNKALVEHVRAQMPSSAPSPMTTMAQEVVESAMFIADITYEPYRVGFATGKLGA